MRTMLGMATATVLALMAGGAVADQEQPPRRVADHHRDRGYQDQLVADMAAQRAEIG